MTPTVEEKFGRLVRSDFLTLSEVRGQMETVSGLMQIDPLRDDDLVGFLAGLPQDLMLFDDRQRGLLRHAMRHVLPERLRTRPDKARFEPAIAGMLDARNIARLRNLAEMRMLGDLGLVDPPLFGRHFEGVLSDGEKSPAWLAVWPALTVEAFLRAQWGNGASEG
jgi:hypothetical protein